MRRRDRHQHDALADLQPPDAVDDGDAGQAPALCRLRQRCARSRARSCRDNVPASARSARHRRAPYPVKARDRAGGRCRRSAPRSRRLTSKSSAWMWILALIRPSPAERTRSRRPAAIVASSPTCAWFTAARSRVMSRERLGIAAAARAQMRGQIADRAQLRRVFDRLFAATDLLAHPGEIQHVHAGPLAALARIGEPGAEIGIAGVDGQRRRDPQQRCRRRRAIRESSGRRSVPGSSRRWRSSGSWS